MNKRAKTEEAKQRIGKIIGSTCFVCGCTKSKKGMTVHHLWYIFNDVVYKNYTRNDDGKLKYYTDLLIKVQETPERFMFLCNTHHQALERLNRYKKQTLNKLLEALQKTKTNL